MMDTNHCVKNLTILVCDRKVSKVIHHVLNPKNKTNMFRRLVPIKNTNTNTNERVDFSLDLYLHKKENHNSRDNSEEFIVLCLHSNTPHVNNPDFTSEEHVIERIGKEIGNLEDRNLFYNAKNISYAFFSPLLESDMCIMTEVCEEEKKKKFIELKTWKDYYSFCKDNDMVVTTWLQVGMDCFRDIALPFGEYSKSKIDVMCFFTGDCHELFTQFGCITKREDHVYFNSLKFITIGEKTATPVNIVLSKEDLPMARDRLFSIPMFQNTKRILVKSLETLDRSQYRSQHEKDSHIIDDGAKVTIEEHNNDCDTKNIEVYTIVSTYEDFWDSMTGLKQECPISLLNSIKAYFDGFAHIGVRKNRQIQDELRKEHIGRVRRGISQYRIEMSKVDFDSSDEDDDKMSIVKSDKEIALPDRMKELITKRDAEFSLQDRSAILVSNSSHYEKMDLITLEMSLLSEKDVFLCCDDIRVLSTYYVKTADPSLSFWYIHYNGPTFVKVYWDQKEIQTKIHTSGNLYIRAYVGIRQEDQHKLLPGVEYSEHCIKLMAPIPFLSFPQTRE